MAKKEVEPKTVLERNYNVPLRRRWMHVPKYKRSKKAMTTLRIFIIKHMKPGLDEKGKIMLKIGKHLNEFLWKHGIKNPPHHVKIIAKKNEKGLVEAELEGAPVEKKEELKKPEAAKEEKKDKEGKSLQGSSEAGTATPAAEEKKEDKAGKKKEEKEKLKAIKKEKPAPVQKAPAVPKQVEKQVTAPQKKG